MNTSAIPFTTVLYYAFVVYGLTIFISCGVAIMIRVIGFVVHAMQPKDGQLGAAKSSDQH